jgi:hypothetical protein
MGGPFAFFQKLIDSARPIAQRTVASLVERGLIVEIGSGPQDPHRRYHLAPSNS